MLSNPGASLPVIELERLAIHIMTGQHTDSDADNLLMSTLWP